MDEFKALYDDPATRPVIIDVRSKEGYDAGHIKGSIAFPEDQIATLVSDLPKDKLVVAYCS
jgi:rhodanese-related sulfurtransferase